MEPEARASLSQVPGRLLAGGQGWREGQQVEGGGPLQPDTDVEVETQGMGSGGRLAVEGLTSCGRTAGHRGLVSCGTASRPHLDKMARPLGLPSDERASGWRGAVLSGFPATARPSRALSAGAGRAEQRNLAADTWGLPAAHQAALLPPGPWLEIKQEECGPEKA